ncbi:leukocyte-associated immunoglobulin-like receptor 1 [Eptesicus fuscus]|uniref:leukocyte-associated immunoglobulin-like receptor 1 n=1 Tax=Eptesicus fuscus TaxID=29078 RepID=UPI00240452FC|nr:leukocyte-associated immunoglobulin-like receptor 1 [Eptesicus fuscus]
MSPRPSTLLGLVLCLGQMIHTQEGALPKPSLRAQPGPVIPRGQPVTFVCRGPAGAELFRLEKEGSQVGSDQNSEPQDGSQGTEARFHIPAVSEDSAGRYRCLYAHVYGYSERSEPVQLQVTEDDVSTRPSGLSREHLYILVGTSVAFLLCLLLLVLLLVHRQHQRKHKSLQSKGEEQRPQERLSPAADITGSRPDEATVCALPEKKRELQSPSPAAGDAQEVTYAQLDQRALTLRAAHAVSPPPAAPSAAASTYAELPRR